MYEHFERLSYHGLVASYNTWLRNEAGLLYKALKSIQGD